MKSKWLQRKILSRVDQVTLTDILMSWATSTTKHGSLNVEMRIADKCKTVEKFFEFIQKSPEQVTVPDVKRWLLDMKRRKLSENTHYTRISRLVSFYDWLMSNTSLGKRIISNPARPVLPKFPTSYQNKSVKAYTDDEIKALFDAVRTEAEKGSLTAKRDYTLMLFFYLSGMRRSEIISLTGSDIEIFEQTMFIKSKPNGVDSQNKELADNKVREALLDYLETAGRLKILGTTSPLWLRHDRGAKSEKAKQMTSHAFDHNLKLYAKEAGIENARIHRFRHTFVRIVSEETKSVNESPKIQIHNNQHNGLFAKNIREERLVQQ